MSAPALARASPTASLPELFELSVFERSEDGIERLRELVIELALSGRLGTSVPSEHSASSLVERARMSLTKEKRRAMSGLELAPFPLPANWVWTQAQELGVISPRNEAPDGKHVGFVPMHVVPTDYRRPVSPEVRPWGDIKKGYTHLADGDVAVAKITPCFQNKKSCVLEALPCGMGAGTTELHVIRPVTGVVEPKFLLLFFKSPLFISAGVPRMTGTAGQKRIPVEYFAAAPLPLPPFPEQKRIVAKVDQLMALCDELEAKQAKKREVGDRLTKAALAALTSAETPEDFKVAWKRVSETFDALINGRAGLEALRATIIELGFRGQLTNTSEEGGAVAALLESIRNQKRNTKTPVLAPVEDGPFAIPSHWKWVRWGDVTLETSSGWSPQCLTRPRDGAEWGVLKVSAVSWFSFSADENKALPGGVPPRPEFAVRDGDFLMSRANTADLVGRSVVVGAAPSRLILSDKIVRCVFGKGVDPKFINLFNRTPAARAHYIAHASGTSDSMKNISREVILSMPIPLAPPDEQRQVVSAIEAFFGLCDQLEGALDTRDALAGHLAGALVESAMRSAA